jgi:hypothetical protein
MIVDLTVNGPVVDPSHLILSLPILLEGSINYREGFLASLSDEILNLMILLARFAML